MGKGSDGERELFKLLWEEGYGVMRSPTSGGGRKEPQPDLLVSNGKSLVAMELKRSQDFPIYVSKEEIRDLAKFCNRFGATPMLAVRKDRCDWKFHHPQQCDKTKKSYKVSGDLESIDILYNGD